MNFGVDISAQGASFRDMFFTGLKSGLRVGNDSTGTTTSGIVVENVHGSGVTSSLVQLGTSSGVGNDFDVSMRSLAFVDNPGLVVNDLVDTYMLSGQMSVSLYAVGRGPTRTLYCTPDPSSKCQ
jgi:hypothetical protein